MEIENRTTSRRRVLTIGAVVLTGCTTSSESPTPTAEHTSSPTASPTPESSKSPTPSPAPSPTVEPTPSPSPTPEPTHPFANTKVTVSVIDSSSTEYDVNEIASEALNYWEEYAPQYAGFAVEFQITDSDGMITLEFLDEPRECGEHIASNILGCAPLLRVGDEISNANAWVVAAQRPRGRIVTTTKHELGHILGLDHDDEPVNIMSTDPEDRIPGFRLRVDIWGQYATALESRHEGDSQRRRAVEYWNRERYAEAADAYDETATLYGEGISVLSDAVVWVDELREVESDTIHGDTLHAFVTDAQSWFEYREEYAQEMASASEDMRRGRRNSAVRHFDAATEALDSSDEISFATFNQIGVALGLDEPIVD